MTVTAYRRYWNQSRFLPVIDTTGTYIYQSFCNSSFELTIRYGTVVRISIDIRLITGIRPRWDGNFLLNLHFIYFLQFFTIYLLSTVTDERGTVCN
jgi:hypothetical protein